VPEIVRLMPSRMRVAAMVFAQACTLGFYLLLAWMGYVVLEVLATDRLVSLPEVSVAYAQSVIPVSAVLIIVAQLLVFPEVLREARSGRIDKAEELI
jgi:TRAP-type C4-dicarboxylate transport system permease small subunit